MKKTSRFLAILLVVAMMASFTAAFAMDKGQHKQFKTYTCIGDSIAAGYTLSGERDNFFRVRVRMTLTFPCESPYSAAISAMLSVKK